MWQTWKGSREGPLERVHSIEREKTPERLSTGNPQAAWDIAVDPAVLISSQRNAEQKRQLALDVTVAGRDSGADVYGRAKSRSDMAGAGRKCREDPALGSWPQKSLPPMKTKGD